MALIQEGAKFQSLFGQSGTMFARFFFEKLTSISTHWGFEFLSTVADPGYLAQLIVDFRVQRLSTICMLATSREVTHE